MEPGVLEEMMGINGGKKIIPTVCIDNDIVTGFDRLALKKLLGVYY